MSLPNRLSPATSPVAVDALLTDLRSRLGAAHRQTSATQLQARRLGRELALARRLLRFQSGEKDVPARLLEAPSETVPVLLSDRMLYHIDRCERSAGQTELSGWSFCPAKDWDAHATDIYLTLRHDDTAYVVPCRRVLRPDLASHFAGLPRGESGGALRLEGAGWECEIADDAIPTGAEWKIVLRLECAGRACEQFTGRTVRL